MRSPQGLWVVTKNKKRKRKTVFEESLVYLNAFSPILLYSDRHHTSYYQGISTDVELETLDT